MYAITKTHITKINQHPPVGRIIGIEPTADAAFARLVEQRPDLWDRWMHRVCALVLVGLVLFGPDLIDSPQEPEIQIAEVTA
jgi:hypothetical protein